MTTETREALRDFASAVKWLAESTVSIATRADRLIRALEQKEGGSLPCGKCGGSGVVDSGGVTPWGAAIDLPCPACNSKWDSWQKDSSLEKWFPMTAEELARLKVEVEQLKRERTVAAIASDYETWRDEQLDTLRKLFRQRGQQYYQSFPNFCREQYEGSDKGKVKV